MNNQSSKNIVLLTLLIVFAALSRIIPHYPNFTAVGAMALFGAAQLRHQWQAFLIPIAALYLSDLVINNIIYAGYYDQFTWQISPFVYLAFLVVLGVGLVLRNKVSTANVVKASLAASVLFFLVTNTASWWVDPMYTKNGMGLMTSYLAALPFFWSTVASDLFYCGVLFGGYAWVQERFPQLAASGMPD